MERRSEPLSRVSTAARSGTRASTPSAIACNTAARSMGGNPPHPKAASRAAATAASASWAPPRATSAIGCSSIGETSVNVRAEATRRPPIQWSVETSTPSIVVEPPVVPSRQDEPNVARSFGSERYGEAAQPVKRRTASARALGATPRTPPPDLRSHVRGARPPCADARASDRASTRLAGSGGNGRTTRHRPAARGARGTGRRMPAR